MKMKCEKCGHEWESRTEKPVACPKCKSYTFDKPKKIKPVK
jgi:predicted Zn-ribbon and HTH transcriptional regulator